MTDQTPDCELSTFEITKSLAYLLLYFSIGVALATAVAMGVSTLATGYDGSSLVFGMFGFVVALVLSAIVGLCVLLIVSPLTYTLGRRLSAKLSWNGRVVAYFGFAILAATGTVVGGLPIAPLINGQPADWNLGDFFANSANPLIAAAIILIAGLSAAAACATIRRSSVRAIRANQGAEDVIDGRTHASFGSVEELS